MRDLARGTRRFTQETKRSSSQGKFILRSSSSAIASKQLMIFPLVDYRTELTSRKTTSLLVKIATSTSETPFTSQPTSPISFASTPNTRTFLFPYRTPPQTPGPHQIPSSRLFSPSCLSPPPSTLPLSLTPFRGRTPTSTLVHSPITPSPPSLHSNAPGSREQRPLLAVEWMPIPMSIQRCRLDRWG
jgi:hypothetical protein